MLTLYSYWRSTAAYRVRVALNLKGLDHEIRPVDISPAAAEQRDPAFLALNPEGRVPVLVHGQRRLAQSTAIIEYLEECHPEPALLPASADARAHVRALAQLIACDLHPLNNVSVLAYLRDVLGADADTVDAWYRHWVHRGLAAFEARLAAGAAHTFCVGEAPGYADLFLVPQLYNARRFACDLSPFPHLVRIEAACLAHEAFDRARPERQPDAPAVA